MKPQIKQERGYISEKSCREKMCMVKVHFQQHSKEQAFKIDKFNKKDEMFR